MRPATREMNIDSAEAQVESAQEVVKGLLGYLHRLPQAPESAHLLKECQRVQGHLAHSLELFRKVHEAADQ
jgi:hypothetical protein